VRLNIFIILLFLPLVVIGKTEIGSSPWVSLTTQDLNAIHEAIEKNDPATAGYATPDFSRWYYSGFQQALQMARQVTSYGGYIATLKFYTNGFYSEHLNVVPLLENQINWPGFVVALRNDEYKVVYRQEGQNELPDLNATLISCDEISPDILMTHFLPFTEDGYARVKSTWTVYVPFLFRDADNPWCMRQRQCVFRNHGIIQTYQLHWQPISNMRFYPIASESAFGPVPYFAIRHFGNNGIWISIPTFQLKDEANNATYAALMRVVNSVRAFRNKNIIVFDLRGNGGGDLTYGQAILHNLYGDDFIVSLGKNHILNQPWTAVLRVSEANIQQYQKLATVFDTSIQKSQELDLKDTIKKMQLAAKQGKTVVSIEMMSPPKKTIYPVKNPVMAKIFLLTDGNCSSSCWLFVREFLQMPNVELVGQPTHFMTRYTMANPILLPSGIMKILVPMQAYTNPLDHFNTPFFPHCIYKEYMGDTVALEKWISMLATHWKNCN